MMNTSVQSARLTFTIMVNSNPHSSKSVATANHFAYALLNQGHQIRAIFFYQDGVYHASQTAMDEIDIYLPQPLQQLSQQHNFNLYLCSTALKKRGIIEKNIDKNKYKIAGLAELFVCIQASDRFITFGGL